MRGAEVGVRVATWISMGFRLKKDESFGPGLARVVGQELRSAIEQLTSNPTDEAVHDARKSIKKVRSVLQLLGDELDARGSRGRLRKASHLLSPIRDADAMLASARSLRSRHSAEQSELVGSLRSRRATLVADADRERIGPRAARALKRVRRKARGWDWDDTTFPVLAKAIRRSYKRARTSLDDVRADSRAETFHEWRKRVKTLWYALRLLERRAPRLQRPIADLKRLQTMLGDDHNLFVLRTQLGSESTRMGWSGRARLRMRIDRRQRELRQHALALGLRLFALPPKVFARRLREMWDSRPAARRAAAA